MRKTGLIIILLVFTQLSWAQFRICQGKPMTIAYDECEEQVVHTALQLFRRDYQAVFSDSIHFSTTDSEIIVATLGRNFIGKIIEEDAGFLKDKKQSFILKVLPKGKLLILGSDPHGTAYGLMELSRLIGVSPWEWWADAIPTHRDSFELPEGYINEQSPSVEYRGIFINDEDWGLMPWSSEHFEPELGQGIIGPRTNARIFELMLRLRANYYWPAMHECTVPFFLTKGNRDIAKKYGVFIGGSHCEPMATSTPGEWKQRGRGDYDYVNNAPEVRQFWEERLKEVADQPILFTLGMRGIHDSQMKGVKGVEEQKEVLHRVISDQRAMLVRYINKDITKIPQVFIPYKEVLNVYNAGLEVPDDVTLMWCDDNYGYIRHFPTAQERMRKGGNGIYYHVSYWGRPHDHLWLCTFHPALIYQQMTEAYDRGIQRMWILNVGDIKPCEYQMELFLDMAWDIEKVKKQGVRGHIQQFFQREFGEKVAKELTPVMLEHYRLNHIRKPEYLGNTRTEEARTSLWTVVKDLPWSRATIDERLANYQTLSDGVEKLSTRVLPSKQDAFYQLVKYPVQAGYQMNQKMLKAQLARHSEANWAESDAAYDSIVSLTRIYNTGIHNQGKWSRMMDHQPRRLTVFEPVGRMKISTPLPTDRKPIAYWNAMECTQGSPIAYESLGYEGQAANIEKEQNIYFDFFDKKRSLVDSVEVELRLLPNHPTIDGTQLRIAVTIDKQKSTIIHYETQGRSEEWKENVLRNQAIRRVIFPIKKKEKHRVMVKALDEGVVLDQLWIYPVTTND